MKIIHISDLHFGAENTDAIQALLKTFKSIQYDLLIVSGDITQRALPSQFKAAKLFLEEIEGRKLIVPGNHDIPFYNLLKRAVSPFYDYKKYINSDLSFECDTEEALILGLNSANLWHGKNGKMSHDSLMRLMTFFEENTTKPKIFVLHHNFLKLPGMHAAIADRKMIMDMLTACKVDIVLSGHLHIPHIKKELILPAKHPVYFITAGTAISKRLRGFVNSFNYLEIEKNKFTLQLYNFSDAEVFVPQEKNEFFLEQ